MTRPAALDLEVDRALFASIAEEMGSVLRRSSASPNIKERLDFSCALFTADGELFSQAAHIPVHLGSAPLSVRAALAAHDFKPGDAVLLNDPYEGGTHLPDLTLVSGVFLGAPQPAFYVATRAHHADVGGSSPGSMASCRDLFGEGLRIPPLPLFEQGVRNETLWRLVEANVRTPDERRIDLLAQTAANHRGVERLEEWAGRRGTDALHQAAEELLRHGERRVRSWLKSVPRGTWSAEEWLEGNGFEEEDIGLRVTWTRGRSGATFDFTASDDQMAGSLNANPAIVRSAVLYAVQCVMDDPDTPPNEGMLRPLRLATRRGSVLEPRPGAAMAGGNVETSQRLVDLLFAVLGQALPGRVPAASQGTMNNLTVGSALDPAFTYYETTGGGAGATAETDGASGIQVHMTNTRNTPIEALEHAYPLRVVETRLARRSGGDGARRGGDGIVRVLELRRDAQVAVLTERRQRTPSGAEGGEAGRCGKNWVVRDGRRQSRPAKFREDLRAGDRIGMQTPGGGGHGRKGV